MRQSDEFNTLGSGLNYVYRDMFLGSRPTGHLYQYIPDGTKKGDKLPVILFLHGSLGNFKGYLWVWKRFADEHGYAIVAPSFGAGNWYLPGGVEAVEQARQYCINHPRLDGQRIILAGLSNGGTGVSRAATRSPTAYKGLIFISPVMEPEILLNEAFVSGWKGRRVLIISGAMDRRIPIHYVKGSATSLKEQGVMVESKYYSDEDHFLMFSKPDQILSNVASWME